LMDEVVYYNWCGRHHDEVFTRMETLQLAIEAGGLVEDDLTTLEGEIASYAANNTEVCFITNATPYHDAPTEAWWFAGAAATNATTINGTTLIEGYSDEEGNLKHEFGAADNTLGIEALAMVVRMRGFDTSSDGPVPAGGVGVPSWGNRYVLASVTAGIELPGLAWDQPITRLQTAELFVLFFRDLIPEVGVTDDVRDFVDYGEFSSLAASVGDLNAAGVFKGSERDDGVHFFPAANLPRSEFATVINRTIDSLGIEVDEG